MSLRGDAQPVGQHRSQTGYSAERGFTAAFELVATPALFGLIGYLLDRWLGTGPVLTIGLTFVVACYVVWKLWYGYNVAMLRLETELINRRTGQSSEAED